MLWIFCLTSVLADHALLYHFDNTTDILTTEGILVSAKQSLLCKYAYPSFYKRVVSKYYSVLTVGFSNQLNVGKRELRIHFWADITHVQSVMLKTSFRIK